MTKEIKLLWKIRKCHLPEIENLICNFEFEIDNNPNEYRLEVFLINKNKNWKELLIEELISSTNFLFNQMRKLDDFEPLIINFNYLSSLFWSERFGLKIKRVGKI